MYFARKHGGEEEREGDHADPGKGEHWKDGIAKDS